MRCSRNIPASRDAWDRLIDPVLAEATLVKPSQVHQRRGGREGIHTEHLGHLLAEMQSMARSFPGCRMVTATRGSPTSSRLWSTSVKDPEIPVMSIGDLGIVRSVETEGTRVIVTITPTYSGCPAMDTIRSDIAATLAEHGFECGDQDRLLAALDHRHDQPGGDAGILRDRHRPAGRDRRRRSARAARRQTRQLVSEFGSTACKALMVCSSCREPFDLFKELK